MKFAHIFIFLLFVNFIAFNNNITYTSSSSLKENSYEYLPDYAFDGKLTTAWCEGSSGVGINEWIKISYDIPELVSGIIIYPGFLKNNDLYISNSTPEFINIHINNKSIGKYDLRIIEDYTFHPEYYEPNKYFAAAHMVNFSPRVIIFDKKYKATEIKIMIEEVIEGLKWKDTLISEIEIINDNYKGTLKKEIDFLLSIREQKTSDYYKHQIEKILDPLKPVKDRLHNTELERQNAITSSKNLLIKYLEYFKDFYINSTLIIQKINNDQNIIGVKSFRNNGVAEWMIGFPIINFTSSGSINLKELYTYGSGDDDRIKFPDELIKYRPYFLETK